MDYLIAYHTPPLPHSPILCINLEGVNLSRRGTATIITFLINVEASKQRVCLIDLHVLGASSFQTAGAMQTTLKDIL